MSQVVSLRVDGQLVELSSEASIQTAMRRGHLSRASRVRIERNGLEDFVGVAADDAILAGLLNEFDPPSVEESPSTPISSQTNAVDRPKVDQDNQVRATSARPSRRGPDTVMVPSEAAPTPRATVDQKTMDSDNSPSVKSPEGTRSSKGPWIVGACAMVVLFVGAVLSQQGSSSPETAPSVPIAAQAEAAAPVNTGVPDTIYEWSADALTNQPVVINGLTIQLISRSTPDGAAPVIRVTDQSGVSHEATGAIGFDVAQAHYAVGELDKANATSELLFMTFSGGAHCCTNILVLDLVGNEWRTVELGDWDGEGVQQFPRDLDGDGTVEISFVDNRFLYAFASYAESFAPTVLKIIDDGEATDVSDRREYRQVFVRDMTEAEPSCREGNNGACAAYVAAASRAGRLNDAWRFMLEHYNSSSDWVLPGGCRIETTTECPPSAQVQFASYPEALQYTLGVWGYMARSYVASSSPNGQPSFLCASAETQIDHLICNTPMIADSDRALAIAYTQALAFSIDRNALQTTQQQFIRMRNALPLDPKLVQQAYSDRISELQGEYD